MPSPKCSALLWQVQSILSTVVRTGRLRVRTGGNTSPRTVLYVAYCRDTRRVVMTEEQPATAVVRMADNTYFKGMERVMVATLPLSDLLEVLSAICASIGQENKYQYVKAAEAAYFMKHGCPAPVMLKTQS